MGFMSTLCDSPKDRFDTYLLCVCIWLLSMLGQKNWPAARILSNSSPSASLSIVAPHGLGLFQVQ